jgi:uncharacterized membrane protein YkoI
MHHRFALCLGTSLLLAGVAQAGDTLDLDDVKNWDLVSVETCLDAALDTVPGNARKLELKIEGDDPTYEFDVQTAAGVTYNVECNAEEGLVTEIEREVAADDAAFAAQAKVSEAEARKFALAVHPGKVVSMEYEVGADGTATYEYDIQTDVGYEVKVDVDASSGQIEEANIEVYEIGAEQE